MDRTRDMTRGNPAKHIFLFALPLILGNLGQQLYMVADAIIVGQGVGVDALAALGATDWTYWVVLWSIQALTQGFAILITHNFGSGNHAALRRSVAASIRLCAVAAVLLTAMGLVGARPMLALLSTPDILLEQATSYLTVMFAGTAVVMAYNMAAAILRAFGDGKSPLIAMGVAAALNVGLDLLFVLVFGWGIVGAAVATLIAQLVSFLYCLGVLRRLAFLRLHREDWENSSAVSRHLLRLGLPLALQHVVIAVGGMVLQSVINSFGFLFVAGFTATNKLYGMLESSAISFGFSTSTYMAQNWGAKRVDRLEKGIKSAVRLSVLVAVAISALMIIFGKSILGLFISTADAGAAQVLDIAYRYLLIMSALLFILYLLHTYRSALQGLGNTVAPMVSGFIEFAMRVGVALALPPLLGELGLFFAEPAAWAGAAVLVIIVYYRQMAAIRGSGVVPPPEEEPPGRMPSPECGSPHSSR